MPKLGHGYYMEQLAQQCQFFDANHQTGMNNGDNMVNQMNQAAAAAAQQNIYPQMCSGSSHESSPQGVVGSPTAPSTSAAASLPSSPSNMMQFQGIGMQNEVAMTHGVTERYHGPRRSFLMQYQQSQMMAHAAGRLDAD
jgi:hypothetical protein